MGKLTWALCAVALLDLALVIARGIALLATPHIWPSAWPGAGGWFSYAPLIPVAPITPTLMPPGAGQVSPLALWLFTAWAPLNSILPLLLSLFALIVAGVTRRWGWLAAFLVAGVATLLAPDTLAVRFPLFVVVLQQGEVDLFSLWGFVIPALAPLLALVCVASAWRNQTARAAHEPDGLTRSALAH